MKSLETLKELIENAEEICDLELKRLNIIKTDLELLELILNKNVSVLRVKVCDNAKEYNENTFLQELTQAEFEKIKARLAK